MRHMRLAWPSRNSTQRGALWPPISAQILPFQICWLGCFDISAPHGHAARKFHRISKPLDESLGHGYCVLSREPAYSKSFGCGLVDSLLAAEVRFCFLQYVVGRWGRALSAFFPIVELTSFTVNGQLEKSANGHSPLTFRLDRKAWMPTVWSKHARMCHRYAAVRRSPDMITCLFLFDAKNLKNYFYITEIERDR